jgi:hypothetical protein
MVRDPAGTTCRRGTAGGSRHPVDVSIAVDVNVAASGGFGGKIAAVVRRPRATGRGAAGPHVKEEAMLEGKTRIPPVDVETLPDDLRETLEEQRKLRGAPLYPYLFYARNPAYFRAAKAMWAALQQETTRVPGTLRALLNRRVAWWNGCEF